MKITFEIKTTCSRPFHITVSEETPMFELRNIIVTEVEYYTIMMRDDVVDIFIPYENDCVSIRELSSDTVKSFIDKYPDYFQKDNLSIVSNFHQLFVMDRLYLDKVQNNDEAPIYKDVIPPKEENIVKTIMTTAISMLTGTGMK
jgi:hypothetical protein